MGSHRTSTILTVWDLTRDAPTTGAPAMSSTWALPSSWLYSLSPGRSSCDLPTTDRPPMLGDLLRWTTPRSWANWKSVSSIPTRPPRPTYARAATGRSRRDSDTWSSSLWTCLTCVAIGTGAAGPDADPSNRHHGSDRREQDVAATLSGHAAAGSELPLLLDLGTLTDAVAEVVELGPTDVTAGPDLDAVDDR